MPQWAMDICLSIPVSWAPWHPGAVKYFKERGVWTKENESRQVKLLEADAKRTELWNRVLSEAKTKNIKGKEFSKFWTEKLKQAGLD